MRLRLLLSLPLLLSACSVQGNETPGARSTDAPPDSARDHSRDPAPAGADTAREAIMEVDRDFARATAARGVEGWLAYFESNNSQVNGGGTVATGFAAIRELMKPTLSDPAVRLTWAPEDAVIAPGAKLGSTVGRWELLRRDSTGAVHPAATGSYLTVWRKQSDGSWKIVADVGNPD